MHIIWSARRGWLWQLPTAGRPFRMLGEDNGPSRAPWAYAAQSTSVTAQRISRGDCAYLWLCGKTFTDGAWAVFRPSPAPHLGGCWEHLPCEDKAQTFRQRTRLFTLSHRGNRSFGSRCIVPENVQDVASSYLAVSSVEHRQLPASYVETTEVLGLAACACCCFVVCWVGG